MDKVVVAVEAEPAVLALKITAINRDAVLIVEAVGGPWIFSVVVGPKAPIKKYVLEIVW